MIEKTGNIWQRYCQPNEFLCITTNNCLTHTGELTMGAGIAKEAKERCPWLPRFWGSDIKRYHLGKDYRFLMAPNNLVALQTKRNWKDPSPLELIKSSLEALATFAAQQFPHWIINCPRPGCGYGGLSWEQQVKPLCESVCKGNQWVIWNK